MSYSEGVGELQLELIIRSNLREGTIGWRLLNPCKWIFNYWDELVGGCEEREGRGSVNRVCVLIFVYNEHRKRWYWSVISEEAMSE